MKLKRIELRIRNGKAILIAFGHMARGAEAVMAVVEVPQDELDTHLRKLELQKKLFMTEVRPIVS
jgi:hypothetical protein